MRHLISLLAAAVIAAAAPATLSGQNGAALPGASNYTRVETTVACGGATTAEAYPVLKKEGFAAVINLRTAGEPGADIPQARAAAEAAGLRYVHIPFDSRNPSPETVEAFLAAVQDPANSPVYIHCASANRVGAVWLVKRVLVDGWDEQRALAEAERIGLKNPALRSFALDYVKARKG